MVVQERRLTAEEFDRLADLPENAERLLEFIAGEIVQMPSNPFASEIAMRILGFLFVFLMQHKVEGHLTGEAGGCMVFGERYTPDVAYISKARQPELAKHGYNPNPPELAVEIDFPGTVESQRKLLVKLGNYLAAGTGVWLVFPETKTIEVCVPGQPVKILGINDTLDGGEVLPGFTLAVKDIFPE